MSDTAEQFAEWTELAKSEMERCRDDPDWRDNETEHRTAVAILDECVAEHIGVTDVTIIGKDIHLLDESQNVLYQGPGIATGIFLGAEYFIDDESGRPSVGYYARLLGVTPKNPTHEILVKEAAYALGSVAANDIWVNTEVFTGGIDIASYVGTEECYTEAARFEALVQRLDQAIATNEVDIKELVRVFTTAEEPLQEFEAEYLLRRLNASFRPQDLVFSGAVRVKFEKNHGHAVYQETIDEKGGIRFYFEGNNRFRLLGDKDNPASRVLCLAHIEYGDTGFAHKTVAVDLSALTRIEGFRFCNEVDD